jgi:S-DNA-T family DNA segregation ATPase FtsK/SpoIIIE
MDIVIEKGKASTSLLQRALGIGYSSAAHIMDRLEKEGIIGPSRGAKPREILVE